MSRSPMVVVLGASTSEYSVRWGSFFLAVGVAAGVVVMVVLLALRTVKLRDRPYSERRRRAALAWTVIVGVAAALSLGVTLIGMLSWGGGDLLGYMFAANLVLIAWFVWRVAQCRLARRIVRSR